MTACLAPAGCPLTVLIADDTPAIRNLVRLTLELAGGFSVVAEAADGAAAVRLAAEHHPDVVLLDLAMPVMDGLQAITGIRLSCPETKIVVLSGFDSERMGPEAIERGAHAYFEKGLRPDLLATRVAEICGGLLTAAEEPSAALGSVPGAAPRPALLNAALADVATPVGFDTAVLPPATNLDAGGELAARELIADYPQPIWLFAQQTFEFLAVNKAAITRYGYKRAEFLAMRATDIVLAEDVPALLHRTANAGRSWEHSRGWQHRLSNGALIDVEVTSRVVSYQGRPAVMAVVGDATERNMLERELWRQALHDSLTGLANRTLFRERVTQALVSGRRVGSVQTVLFLDVDGFKAVNDGLGHAAGDEVLVVIAERLQAVLGKNDTAARTGGDGFGILLPGRSEMEGIEVAERILDAVARPMRTQGNDVTVSVTIGVVSSSFGGSADDLLRNADVAMHEAKAMGKNCSVAFRPEMHDAVMRRLNVESDLRRALNAHELILYFQPTVSLADGHPVGVEALVRWAHPERGLLLPDEFVSHAEDCGLIRPLGRWVLEEACHQTRQWTGRPGDAPFDVAVNVSARQLEHVDFTREVTEALESTGFAPDRLVLELTEGALLDDLDTTHTRLWALKDLGVRIALDDFGTGYSSLGYLRRLPVDILKVDRMFTAGITGSSREAAVPEAVIHLAHTFGLATVAEGVESEEQAQRLRDLGCDMAQGFHFSRPISGDHMTGYLRDPPA